MKKALITGITGQDGSYLAELLLNKGYEVHGVIRRASMENASKMENVKDIIDKIKIHPCSLENSLSVYKVFADIKPDECYHLAASSFVSYSSDDDLTIMSNNFRPTHNILMSMIELAPKCKMYFAASSEVFGNVSDSPQDESTPYNPRSIYGISKLASHCLVKNYRDRNNLFACTGFTYNHESPRRGRSFVTRKITSSVAAIKLGFQEKIELGNIDARRDWGYAPEYVEAMYLMLQSATPKDYVIATGKLHTVRELLDIAFSHVGLHYENYIKINPTFVRPDGNTPLVGNSTAIRNDLGWQSSKSFQKMIEEMVDHDLNLALQTINK